MGIDYKLLLPLVLGSAVIGALFAALGAVLVAVISSRGGATLKHAELRHERLKLAMELTRMRLESDAKRFKTLPTGERQYHADPGVILFAYFRALDEIATTGTWKRIQANPPKDFFPPIAETNEQETQ